MNEHEKLNYVEFSSRSIPGTKAFFEKAFGWTKVTRAGGKIIKPIFAFPGGRRFHFTEPGGNEFAVWSDGA